VSREDKVEEWFQGLQAALRRRDGSRLTDGQATGLADLFWYHLAKRSMPIKDIMNTDSQSAIEWALRTDQELVLFVGTPRPEEEPA
jgi:hypothetical protein